MSETFYPSSKAKANRSGRSQQFSSEALPRSRVNLNAIRLPFVRATIWPTKLMSGQSSELLQAVRTNGSGMTRPANMSDAGSSWAGHRNSLPGALKSYIRSDRSAMKPFTNGSTLMPGISSRLSFERTKIENEEAIHGDTRRPISRREYRSKNAQNKSSFAKNRGTGRQILLFRVKASPRFKSALSARPGLASLPSCSGKALTP